MSGATFPAGRQAPGPERMVAVVTAAACGLGAGFAVALTLPVDAGLSVH